MASSARGRQKSRFEAIGAMAAVAVAIAATFTWWHATTTWFVDVSIAGGACELPRLDGSSADLLKQIELADGPVIVTGVASAWRALTLWQRREYVVEQHGNLPIPPKALVNRSLDVAQDGVNFVAEEARSELRHLLEAMADDASGAASLLFQRSADRSSLVNALAADLQGDADWELLPPLASWGMREKVLSVGGPSKGLPPHKHTAAWLVVVVGRKAWSLLPPDAFVDQSSAPNLTLRQELYHRAALQSADGWDEALIKEVLIPTLTLTLTSTPALTPTLTLTASSSRARRSSTSCAPSGCATACSVRASCSSCRTCGGTRPRTSTTRSPSALRPRAFSTAPSPVNSRPTERSEGARCSSVTWRAASRRRADGSPCTRPRGDSSLSACGTSSALPRRSSTGGGSSTRSRCSTNEPPWSRSCATRR